MSISRGGRTNVLDTEGRQYEEERREESIALTPGQASRYGLYKQNGIYISPGQESRYALYNPISQTTMTMPEWFKVGLITAAIVGGIAVFKRGGRV
jgi:hypothetical protein